MRSTLIVTAFEPSGDAHAAPVIAALRRRRPDLRVIGWGGPRMAEAGAEIVQETVAEGAMGVQALGRYRFIRQERERLRAWLSANSASIHLAVDSPAANAPLCRVSREAGLSVIHLVAPQLWAWGPWRARRLRATTDLVLCLLPFEEAWFTARSIPARFVGHPRIDRVPEPNDSIPLPEGAPRVGLFPGSRLQEVRANLPLMLAVLRRLRAARPELVSVIAAANTRMAASIEEVAGRAERPPIVLGASDTVAAWCDAALTVSGTMSLDLTRLGTPMVGIYRTTRFAVLASGLLLRTPHRLLPNIVAGARIVPEFVPCVANPAPIAEALGALLDDPAARETQKRALAEVVAQFGDHRCEEEAADAVLEVLSRRSETA